MLHIGRDKECSSCLKIMTLTGKNKLTMAGMDEIKFILFMRSLCINAIWRVKLNGHGTMGECANKWLTHRPFRRCFAGYVL